MSSMADKLYDGTVEFGLFYSKVIYYIGIAIAIIMVVVGFYLVQSDQSNLIDSSAVITAATCTLDTKNNMHTYHCSYDIKYTVNNVAYTRNIQESGTVKKNIGDSVDITYNSTSPADVTSKIVRNKWIGFGLSICALIIAAFSAFKLYIVTNYKIAAAAQGASVVASVISGPFRQY